MERVHIRGASVTFGALHVRLFVLLRPAIAYWFSKKKPALLARSPRSSWESSQRTEKSLQYLLSREKEPFLPSQFLYFFNRPVREPVTFRPRMGVHHSTSLEIRSTFSCLHTTFQGMETARFFFLSFFVSSFRHAGNGGGG
jgi:hypothetical protein